MTKAAARVLVLILVIFLSFGISLGSVFTSVLFRSMFSGGGTEPPEFFMPVLTRFAIHWHWLLITIVCVFSFAGMALSVCRVPEALVAAIGIAMPLLTSWFTAFSYSYEYFLGSVSMHHAQWFEIDSLLFSFGGFFPISFLLIVLLLALCIRDTGRQLGLIRRRRLE